MKSRTLIATIGTVAALCIVGWMIYDGTQVAEVKTARVKLHSRQVPFKKILPLKFKRSR